MPGTGFQVWDAPGEVSVGARLVGSGCRMPREMYLSAGCWILGVECLRGSTCEYWVLGSPHLGSQAQQQGQCCCSGESSDPSHGQQNTQFRKPRISQSPCQSRERATAGNGASSSLPALLGIWSFPSYCCCFASEGDGKGAAGVLDALGHFHLFLFRFSQFFSSPSAYMSCEVGCKNLEKSRI